jgi:rubrerythrin
VGTKALHCSTCGRNVYVAEADTPVCPVCSAPLIAVVEAEGDADEESEPAP